MAYKWIAEEIERLDPHVDYERIFALSSVYYLNDFDFNVIYTYAVPYLMLVPWGGETLARSGDGKMLTEGQKRQDDTMRHFILWFERGPSDPAVQRSVAKVNRIHQRIAELLPGNYSFDDDFLYTLCFLGCDLHRMRVRVGLKGFTDNQKIASHLLWQELAKQVWTETGNTLDFPTSFDEMLAFMDRYETTPWKHSPDGARTCEALLQQFENKWFPRPLKPLARTLIQALFTEPIRRIHRQPDVHPLARRAVEFGLRTELLIKEKILPDPKHSTPERRRRKLARDPHYAAPMYDLEPGLTGAAWASSQAWVRVPTPAELVRATHPSTGTPAPPKQGPPTCRRPVGDERSTTHGRHRRQPRRLGDTTSDLGHPGHTAR